MIRHDRLPPRPMPTPTAIELAGVVADAARTLAPWGRQAHALGLASWKAWRPSWKELGPRGLHLWQQGQALGSAWLAPKPLAAATALPPTLALAWLLQHGTPCFEWWPLLSDVGALGVTLMAGMVGVGAIARRGAKAPAVAIAVGMALLATTELGIMAARHRYQSERLPSRPEQVPRQSVGLAIGSQAMALSSADGVSLSATYFKNGHGRAVLLIPGWHGSKNDFATTTLAQWLSHRFDVLVLEPRGQGASGGSKSPELPEKADVVAGVNFLREEGHAKVAVWAEEEAGLVAAAAGALRPGIDALAWAGPTMNWGGALDRDALLGSPAGLLKRWGSRATMGLRLSGGSATPDPKALLRLVAPTPLLLVAGEAKGGDGLASLHLAAQEPKALILLGNPGRSPSWDRYASYHAEVSRWLDLVMPLGVPLAPPPQAVDASGGLPAASAPTTGHSPASLRVPVSAGRSGPLPAHVPTTLAPQTLLLPPVSVKLPPALPLEAKAQGGAVLSRPHNPSAMSSPPWPPGLPAPSQGREGALGLPEEAKPPKMPERPLAPAP